MLTQTTVDVPGGSFRLARAGSPDKPPMLFLHGWPENWRAFERLLELAESDFFALAPDLPGIGGSRFREAPTRKAELARAVHDLVATMGLAEPPLIGSDVGGQVVFSYLSQFGAELRAAVILDVVVPGLGPWDDGCVFEGFRGRRAIEAPLPNHHRLRALHCSRETRRGLRRDRGFPGLARPIAVFRPVTGGGPRGRAAPHGAFRCRPRTRTPRGRAAIVYASAPSSNRSIIAPCCRAIS